MPVLPQGRYPAIYIWYWRGWALSHTPKWHWPWPCCWGNWTFKMNSLEWIPPLWLAQTGFSSRRSCLLAPTFFLEQTYVLWPMQKIPLITLFELLRCPGTIVQCTQGPENLVSMPGFMFSDPWRPQGQESWYYLRPPSSHPSVTSVALQIGLFPRPHRKSFRKSPNRRAFYACLFSHKVASSFDEHDQGLSSFLSTHSTQ